MSTHGSKKQEFFRIVLTRKKSQEVDSHPPYTSRWVYKLRLGPAFVTWEYRRGTNWYWWRNATFDIDDGGFTIGGWHFEFSLQWYDLRYYWKPVKRGDFFDRHDDNDERPKMK